MERDNENLAGTDGCDKEPIHVLSNYIGQMPMYNLKWLFIMRPELPFGSAQKRALGAKQGKIWGHLYNVW